MANHKKKKCCNMLTLFVSGGTADPAIFRLSVHSKLGTLSGSTSFLLELSHSLFVSVVFFFPGTGFFFSVSVWSRYFTPLFEFVLA